MKITMLQFTFLNVWIDIHLDGCPAWENGVFMSPLPGNITTLSDLSPGERSMSPEGDLLERLSNQKEMIDQHVVCVQNAKKKTRAEKKMQGRKSWNHYV